MEPLIDLFLLSVMGYSVYLLMLLLPVAFMIISVGICVAVAGSDRFSKWIEDLEYEKSGIVSKIKRGFVICFVYFLYFTANILIKQIEKMENVK